MLSFNRNCKKKTIKEVGLFHIYRVVPYLLLLTLR